jgi:integrase
MPRRSEGSVYQRHDHPSCTDTDHRCYGHWVAAVTVEGRRVVRYRRTKREALDELRRMLADRDRGTLANDRTTVTDWLDHWYETVATAKVRESTLRGYRSKIDNYLVPELGRKRLSKLTPSDIERSWAVMRERGLSPRTIAQAHAILHNALSKAVKSQIIPANPADLADKPPVRRQTPVVFDPHATSLILTAAEGDWLEARWWVALTLGLRQGEALGLTWPDVDFTQRDDAPHGSVTVRRSLQRSRGRGLVHVEPKSYAGYRAIPMRADMADKMRQHQRSAIQAQRDAGNIWNNQLDLVFTWKDGRPVTPELDNRQWHALLRKAGQPPVKLHAARHTAITGWLLAGVSMHTAKVWAGHSSIQITSDTYGGLVPQMGQQGVAALERIYSDTPALALRSHTSEA